MAQLVQFKVNKTIYCPTQESFAIARIFWRPTSPIVQLGMCRYILTGLYIIYFFLIFSSFFCCCFRISYNISWSYLLTPSTPTRSISLFHLFHLCLFYASPSPICIAPVLLDVRSTHQGLHHEESCLFLFQKLSVVCSSLVGLGLCDNLTFPCWKLVWLELGQVFCMLFQLL